MNALEILNRIGTVGDQSDAALLRRYLDVQDAGSEAALTALIERHGSMVLGVCRQVLGHSQDADDAFQATFLIFVRKASSVRRADSVANWLHGVALRVSKRSQADAAKRKARESRVVMAARTDEGPLELWSELHEEVARLPERYREAVVLCYLEGLTVEAAAIRIGCPRGTVLSRLSRARDRLRDRLTRRGFSAPSTWVVAGRAGHVLPARLLETTLKASLGFAGRGLSAAVVSESVMILTRETLSAMTKFHTKMLGLVAAVFGSIGLGAGFLMHAASGSPLQKPEAPPEVKAEKPAAAVLAVSAENKKLAEEQIKLAEATIEMLTMLFRNARIEGANPSFALWNRRLVEASRAAGYDREKLIVVVEDYLKRSETREAVAKALKESARGTDVAIFEARYCILEARIWLNELKAQK